MKPETQHKGITISDIRNDYPRQWVAVEITRRDEYGWPIEGIVIDNVGIRDKSRLIRDISQLDDDQYKDIYIFYTGRIDDVDDQVA